MEQWNAIVALAVFLDVVMNGLRYVWVIRGINYVDGGGGKDRIGRCKDDGAFVYKGREERER